MGKFELRSKRPTMAAQPIPATRRIRLLWLLPEAGWTSSGSDARIRTMDEGEDPSHPAVEFAPDPLEAISRFRMGRFDALLASFPCGWSADALLEEAQRVGPGLPVVIHDATLTDDAVARLIRLGAFDVWREPMDRRVAPERIEALLDHARMRDSVWRLSEAVEPWRRFLVGESLAIHRVLDVIRLIGSRKCTVLIHGETGTGKEMAARAIHMASSRSNLPMVAVNCSALPENLLEAELFGHVKGAFTGAVQSRVGRFEQAHKSTLFLDEIGELTLELQTKLLRVLQEREFQRIGSSETIKVDVRIVAASNADLQRKVREGTFREDLFYRINVVPIQMPALRERGRDIQLLTQYFIEKVCRLEEVPVKRIAPETLDRLARYSWPGNVRQLENAVEMAPRPSRSRWPPPHAPTCSCPKKASTSKPPSAASS
jgi:DNA-binding NtrC family response regulator